MGPVLGWTSSTSNEEADMPPFSPFQSWDSVPSATPPHSLPPSHPPRTFSFPSARPPLHRHTISSMTPPASLAQNRRTSNSPSDRRARHKREEDPNWVPRPLNSFMVFRVEYSRQHAQEQKSGDMKSSSVAEKTLSKRASEAWKKMSQAERQVYKDRAEEIKAEHGRLHPNYRYKPRRKNTKETRSVSVMSRREQVVSFMERHVQDGDLIGNYHDQSPPDDHTSLGSSSPEPPEIPRRVTTPTRSVRRRRSYSLPLSGAAAPDQYRPPYPLHPEEVSPKFPRSQSTVFYNELFSLYGEDSDSVGFSTPTTPSSPDISYFDTMLFNGRSLSVSDGLSPQTTGSSIMPDMLVQGGLGSIPETATAPQLPLVQRRQRSNTTSAIPPSPLNLVSSSLSNWNGIAAASTSSLPTWGLTHSSPNLGQRALRGDMFSSPSQSQTQVSTMLTPGNGTLCSRDDLESQRTPRMAEFSADVQSPYLTLDATVQSPGMVTEPFPEYPHINGGYELGADLEAYAAGLEALNIAPEAYDILSPPDELNFSDLFHVSP